MQKIAEAELNVTTEPRVSQYVTIQPKDPNFVYFECKVIGAGETCGPNANGDFFPWSELLKAYPTLVERPIFLNHEASDLRNAVGKVIDAYPVEDPKTKEQYIVCVGRVDRVRCPDIARMLETGDIKKVSMGCNVRESICSICGHVQRKKDDPKCPHIESMLLQEVDGKKVYMINKGIIFTELSLVSAPAWSRADVFSVVSSLKTGDDDLQSALSKLKATEFVSLLKFAQNLSQEKPTDSEKTTEETEEEAKEETAAEITERILDLVRERKEKDALDLLKENIDKVDAKHIIAILTYEGKSERISNWFSELALFPTTVYKDLLEAGNFIDGVAWAELAGKLSELSPEDVLSKVVEIDPVYALVIMDRYGWVDKIPQELAEKVVKEALEVEELPPELKERAETILRRKSMYTKEEIRAISSLIRELAKEGRSLEEELPVSVTKISSDGTSEPGCVYLESQGRWLYSDETGKYFVDALDTELLKKFAAKPKGIPEEALKKLWEASGRSKAKCIEKVKDEPFLKVRPGETKTQAAARFCRWLEGYIEGKYAPTRSSLVDFLTKEAEKYPEGVDLETSSPEHEKAYKDILKSLEELEKEVEKTKRAITTQKLEPAKVKEERLPEGKEVTVVSPEHEKAHREVVEKHKKLEAPIRETSKSIKIEEVALKDLKKKKLLEGVELEDSAEHEKAHKDVRKFLESLEKEVEKTRKELKLSSVKSTKVATVLREVGESVESIEEAESRYKNFLRNMAVELGELFAATREKIRGMNREQALEAVERLFEEAIALASGEVAGKTSVELAKREVTRSPKAASLRKLAQVEAELSDIDKMLLDAETVLARSFMSFFAQPVSGIEDAERKAEDFLDFVIRTVENYRSELTKKKETPEGAVTEETTPEKTAPEETPATAEEIRAYLENIAKAIRSVVSSYEKKASADPKAEDELLSKCAQEIEDIVLGKKQLPLLELPEESAIRVESFKEFEDKLLDTISKYTESTDERDIEHLCEELVTLTSSLTKAAQEEELELEEEEAAATPTYYERGVTEVEEKRLEEEKPEEEILPVTEEYTPEESESRVFRLIDAIVSAFRGAAGEAPEAASVEASPKTTLEKRASLFDTVSTVVVNEGVTAVKDEKTGEVVFRDKEGKEIIRTPDGYSEKLTDAIALMQKIVSLAKLPEEVEVEKKLLEKKKEVSSIIEVMLEKGMIQPSEQNIQKYIQQGSPFVDARKRAMRDEVSQIERKLMGMNKETLLAFRELVEMQRVEKRSALDQPLSLSHNEAGEDDWMQRLPWK